MCLDNYFSSYHNCIATRLDNLLTASKNILGATKILLHQCKTKIKSTSIFDYYLDCNLFEDEDQISYFTSRKHIKKIVGNYENEFKYKANASTYLDLNTSDYSKLGTLEFLGTE